jgi:pimeloyl-ACP methyl ester carboxylesterase
MTTPIPQKLSAQRTVVLIHGWASNPLFMALLSNRMQALGYRTINWGYWSLGRTIEHHGAGVQRLLAKLADDPETEGLYLVTHSMGGIVARHALTLGKPEKLQRMVMLAPPNRGSHWATWFGPLLKPFCRTLDQLATRADSFVNRLPAPDNLEVGIIAAGFDLLVPTSHTQLPTQRDHWVAPAAHHTGVLFRRSVVQQIDSFFRTGHFLHAAPAAKTTPTSSA